MSAKIYETTDYDRFELLPFNRKLRSMKALDKSMRKYGFLDCFPIGIEENGKNKLLIKFGHHRFVKAKELGLPIKYVFVKNNVSVHEMEESTNPWNLQDFLDSYCQCGRPEYLKILEYHEETGIGLGQAISMLGGQAAGSGNLRKAFRTGTFKLSSLSHARIVGDLVTYCSHQKISIATNTLFVKAISKVAWADGFDPNVLKRKIKSFPFLLERQPTVDDYLKMLDVIYNRQSKDKIPLAFLAHKAAKERSATGSKQ